MKRLMAIVLAFMLVTMGITIAAATDTVTTTDMGFIPEGYAGDGYLNVGFSNGYYGFCMDEGLAGTVVGDSFTITPASQAENNNNQPTNVSNLLKAVFTEGFHTLFQKDAADNYVMTQETSQIAQRATWHFTDGYVDNWDSISPVITAAQSAVDGGLTIPDNGYTKQVDDTTEVT
ncbi:MAG: Cys-Gln thioester bond-forming surface protein, partial [Clostridia bacterium]|nr:Cys-Gln thioester bond-forming surface protein [Clostridia bacterium]